MPNSIVCAKQFFLHHYLSIRGIVASYLKKFTSVAKYDELCIGIKASFHEIKDKNY